MPIQANPKFISAGVKILKDGFSRYGRDPETLRVRGQLQMRFDEQGIPSIDKTLGNLQAGLTAGITDLEIFPSGFIKNSKDLSSFFEKIANLKK